MRLNNFRTEFLKSLNNDFASEFWVAFKNTFSEFNLDKNFFLDLLKAFEQDITKNRFKSFEEILNYCRFSANPVGKIILRLYGFQNSELDKLSDKICTGLQLTNFYQDLKIDLAKNRIYLPLDELESFNVSEKDLFNYNFNYDIKKLLSFQIQRNKKFYDEGKQLLNYLSNLLRIQIQLTINGGEKILTKIEQLDFNVLKFRPKLTKFDILSVFIKTIL